MYDVYDQRLSAEKRQKRNIELIKPLWKAFFAYICSQDCSYKEYEHPWKQREIVGAEKTGVRPAEYPECVRVDFNKFDCKMGYDGQNNENDDSPNARQCIERFVKQSVKNHAQAKQMQYAENYGEVDY